MSRNLQNIEGGKIVLYKNKLEVQLEKNTVWLTQAQIAILFGTKRPAITKHISNIFKSKELDQNSVCSKKEHTATDGKKYKTKFYNLDAIISIGYRVNSNQATQFRIWATKVLKQHLVEGYTINEKRLKKQEQKYLELKNAVAFEKVKTRAMEAAQEGSKDKSAILRTLDARQRKVLILFHDRDKIKAPDIGELFNVKPRTSTAICRKWIKEGFIIITDSSRKARKYSLAKKYENLIK